LSLAELIDQLVSVLYLFFLNSIISMNINKSRLMNLSS
jgi:hypothetical protein